MADAARHFAINGPIFSMGILNGALPLFIQLRLCGRRDIVAAVTNRLNIVKTADCFVFFCVKLSLGRNAYAAIMKTGRIMLYILMGILPILVMIMAVPTAHINKNIPIANMFNW